MFGYLRLFSLLSLLAVIAVALMAGSYFRRLETQELIQLLEGSSSNLSHGYVDNVWRKYSDTIVTLSLNEPEKLQNNPQVAQFAQETMQYFQRMSLVRVNIYNSAGKLLMTVNPGSAAGQVRLPQAAGSLDGGFVTRQLNKTEPASALILNVQAQNAPAPLSLLQTVLPIRSVSGNSNEGVMEMLRNVSPQLHRIEEFQNYATYGFVSLFGVFLVVLFFTSKRAENIIAKQYEGTLELAAAAATAQAESQEKSQFLANVSHELRTPLNAIIGFSNILKNEVIQLLDNKKYHDYIHDIHSSGVHLLSLINDILDYSKAEAGKLEMEVEEVNAAKLVQNSMRLVAPRAEVAQVALVEAMPKETVILMTDSKKFRQILLNLLSNAVKFTKPGGQVRISAWRNVTDDSYSFEVKDTGIGIAPKDISRAMMPFGQVDSALSRKYEGTGLGLPLTKKFVELMGGKFVIESEVNVGTTITFTLPRDAKSRSESAIKQQPELQAAAAVA